MTMKTLCLLETVLGNLLRGSRVAARWLVTPRSLILTTRSQAADDFVQVLETYLDARLDGELVEASRISLGLGALKLTGPFEKSGT